MSTSPKTLVQARALEKFFTRRTGVWAKQGEPVRAVRGVDLDIRQGEIVGLVGESGSGKSTLGRMLIRLIDPDAGTLLFDGTDLLAVSPPELRSLRESPAERGHKRLIALRRLGACRNLCRLRQRRI